MFDSYFSPILLRVCSNTPFVCRVQTGIIFMPHKITSRKYKNRRTNADGRKTIIFSLSMKKKRKNPFPSGRRNNQHASRKTILQQLTCGRSQSMVANARRTADSPCLKFFISICPFFGFVNPIQSVLSIIYYKIYAYVPIKERAALATLSVFAIISIETTLFPKSSQTRVRDPRAKNIQS